MKSVYIHIPFCSSICSYCDFCKLFYNEQLVDKYLDILSEEIKEKYQYEEIKTIYIGGGTPTSLNIKQLTKLFEIIKIFNFKNIEYTIECNIENLTEEKIDLFKKYGINRLSIGIQTFNQKNLKYLNRNHDGSVSKIINYAKEQGFDNINIDLIYGINDETIEMLKEDLKLFLNLNVNHISTYSIIIEPHTKLYIDKTLNIDDSIDSDMYNLIIETLENNDFKHYEVSNFAKTGYESKHNLTYWNNEEYYGFGLSSSGYINDIRYTNTRNINKYLNKEFIFEEHILDKLEQMENEMILGLRKLEGVDMVLFEKKYNIKINEVFKTQKLLEEGKLVIKDNYIFINKEYIYLSNDILINFIGD